MLRVLRPTFRENFYYRIPDALTSTFGEFYWQKVLLLGNCKASNTESCGGKAEQSKDVH